MRIYNSNDSLQVRNSTLRDGEILLKGYKHAMVQIIAASVAIDIPLHINNAPLVDDTFVLKDILNECGCVCNITSNNFNLDSRSFNSTKINSDLSELIHGSLYLVPAFAVRSGSFSFRKAGGCPIGTSTQGGERPTSQVFSVLSVFGFETTLINDTYEGKRIKDVDSVEINIMDYSDHPDFLSGPKISGATKTAILLSLGTTTTKILNPYLKTDVKDLLRFIKNHGFKVEVSKQCIEISKEKLHPKIKKEFSLTSCVSEVITYITLAVLSNIELTINIYNLKGIMQTLKPEMDMLAKMGINLEFEDEKIIVRKTDKIKNLNIDVTNETIQSDHHPFFTLMLLKADKASVINEFVWRDRFMYVDELRKLGAVIERDENSILIKPSTLKIEGTNLIATDTRSAAVLLTATVSHSIPSRIENIKHLYRGYEGLIESINKLGGNTVLSQN
jgi:UDP-N-acetylglucosamine 1-carboxyvinyltransferase